MKHKFKLYTKLQREMECLELQIYKLNAEIQSPRIQILSDMPKGGEPIQTEDKIVKLIELKHELNNTWDNSINLRVELEKFIKELNDPIDGVTLRYYYFDEKSLDEIGELLRYDRSTVGKRIKRIFKNIPTIPVLSVV